MSLISRYVGYVSKCMGHEIIVENLLHSIIGSIWLEFPKK